MNLSEWADLQEVHPQTAYRWFREGTLPVPARQVGRLILVGELDTSTLQSGSAVVYARVSSADQRTDLDRQVARVTTWATTNGHSIDWVVTEVGSGLNGKRRKFLALLSDPFGRPSWSNIETGSPDSGRNTSLPRWGPMGDDWSWWTTRKSTTTSFAT